MLQLKVSNEKVKRDFLQHDTVPEKKEHIINVREKSFGNKFKIYREGVDIYGRCLDFVDGDVGKNIPDEYYAYDSTYIVKIYVDCPDKDTFPSLEIGYINQIFYSLYGDLIKEKSTEFIPLQEVNGKIKTNQGTSLGLSLKDVLDKFGEDYYSFKKEDNGNECTLTYFDEATSYAQTYYFKDSLLVKFSFGYTSY